MRQSKTLKLSHLLLSLRMMIVELFDLSVVKMRSNGMEHTV